jgi:hypothetical protein
VLDVPDNRILTELAQYAFSGCNSLLLDVCQRSGKLNYRTFAELITAESRQSTCRAFLAATVWRRSPASELQYSVLGNTSGPTNLTG